MDLYETLNGLRTDIVESAQDVYDLVEVDDAEQEYVRITDKIVEAIDFLLQSKIEDIITNKIIEEFNSWIVVSKSGQTCIIELPYYLYEQEFDDDGNEWMFVEGVRFEENDLIIEEM